MTCYYLDLGSASDWLKIFLIQSEALPRSGQWFVISMEFLPSFLGNWLPQSWWLALRNVSCFLKTRFHWERSRSQNRNQKHRTLRTSENSVLILLIPLTTPLFTIKWKLGRHAECALWLVYPSASASDSDVSGVGRKWKRSDSSDSDSVAPMTPLTSPIFLFSLGHKRSFDSAYDSNSDSIVCENQSSDHVFCCGSVIFYPWFKFYFSLFLGMLNYMSNNEFETEKWKTLNLR